MNKSEPSKELSTRDASGINNDQIIGKLGQNYVFIEPTQFISLQKSEQDSQHLEILNEAHKIPSEERKTQSTPQILEKFKGEDEVAFDFFAKSALIVLKKLHPEQSESQRISILYTQWESMSQQEKENYLNQAREKEGKLKSLEAKLIVGQNADVDGISELKHETPETSQSPSISKDKFDMLMIQVKTLFGLHYMKSDGIPTEVVNGLYIGSIGAALNKNNLKELGITHIMCCCDRVKQAFPDDFVYKMFPLLDKPSEDIKRFFDEASEYIENTLNQNNKILVHCFAGKSRSTTIMISYFIKYRNMTTEEALETIKKKRGVVQPNLGIQCVIIKFQGFIKQLKDYEKFIKNNQK